MSLSASAVRIPSETVRAASGAGTIESPWLGWEDQIEAAIRGQPRTFLFPAGFWGVGRTVRLGTGVEVGPQHAEDGRPWLVPVADVDALLIVDGSHETNVQGLGLEGRGGRARHGIVVRCGTRALVRGCRFDDFTARDGAALRVAGESADRWVRGVVVEGCTFLGGTVGLSIERDARDLLVTGNRFEDFGGPSIRVDPRGDRVEYGMLILRNRFRDARAERAHALVRIGAGARSLRFAENRLEGAEEAGPTVPEAPPGIELEGGGPAERLRLEVLMNVFTSLCGPAIEARRCGPGLLACANEIAGCGTSHRAAVTLSDCRGAVVEDNTITAPRGTGLRLAECRRVRAHGNEILTPGAGADATTHPAAGIVVEGARGHRVRLGDNRVAGATGAGIDIRSGTGLRIVGNEVQDCHEGIRVRAGRAVVLVGNDCRANGTGIAVDRGVARAVLALNCTVRNGRTDLSVRGSHVRCRDNTVEREEQPGERRPDPHFGA